MKDFFTLSNWIAIKTIEEEKRGSLYVPGNAGGEQYRLGHIVKLPNNLTDAMSSLNVGDTVFFDSLGAVKFRFNDQVLYLIQSREILLTVKDSE